MGRFFHSFSARWRALTAEGPLALIVRLTALAFLVSIGLSWPLYLQHGRIFPVSPWIDALAAAPARLDWVLLIGQCGLLLWLMVQPYRRGPAGAVFAILFYWVMQDVLRLQPYTYLYGFTFLFAALHRDDKRDGLRALRLMVIGVYFWAGFHKLNATFLFDVFPWFIAPIYKFNDTATLSDRIAMGVGFATPLFEMAIGLLLLFRRTRRVATYMAGFMLAMVLICLGPLGHNTNMVVWPWNLQLFATEYLLFARTEAAAVKIKRRGDGLWWVAYLLFIIAPALSLLGYWPAYPAFRLYSGNISNAAVSFGKAEPPEQLPRRLGELLDADHVLSLGAWTNAEFHTVVYPSDTVFLNGAKGLCPYLRYPWEAKLRISLAPPFYEMEPRRIVMPLCGDVPQTEWRK